MSCLQAIPIHHLSAADGVRPRCGSMLIVFLLTLCGWVPGAIAALIILNKNK